MLKTDEKDQKILDQILPETSKYEKEFALTDFGNCERLSKLHGKTIRFCFEYNKFLTFTGKRWEIDNSGEVERRAKETVRDIYRQAATVIDDEPRKALIRHGQRSESFRSIQAMINLLKSEPGIPISSDGFDSNPFLLNCLNGTIDLKTGQLLPHKSENYITKIIPVLFDPKATCPLWVSFLNEIMGGNEDLIEFLQRAVGYGLTGSNREQVLFMLHGAGANGKSTFLETIGSMLGDYSQQTPTEMLLQRDRSSVPNDLARLAGIRFVIASEVTEGRRLNESLIKQMTGGERLTARFLRAEFFEFVPQFKLFLATNHRPVIKGTDLGIWRRIRLIPFEVTIPPEKRDKNLLNKLKAELPGILNWTVKGCLKWLSDGLGEPAEVTAATESYRSEMDVLADFLSECCITTNRNFSSRSSELYRKFQEFCKDSGEKQMTQKSFSMRLSEKGFIKEKNRMGAFWLGIGIIDDIENRMEKANIV